jgi:hypothetical protein
VPSDRGDHPFFGWKPIVALSSDDSAIDDHIKLTASAFHECDGNAQGLLNDGRHPGGARFVVSN